MSDLQQIAREKALYRYNTALEQGDFAVVSEVLAQAEKDTLLEQMILELNEAQMMAENPTASFDLDNVKRERPSSILSRPTRLYSFRSFFTRAHILAVSFALIGIVVLLFITNAVLTTNNRYAADNYEFYGQPSTSRMDELAEPTAYPYEVISLADAPRASIAEYSILSRSNMNSENATVNQPTPTSLLLPPTPAPAIVAQVEIQPRFIVRNGAVQASVEDTLALKQTIEDRVAGMADEGAFVISSNENGRANNLPTVIIALRVPVARFDEMMDWLADQAAEGTVPTRSETADDVTAEYVDLAARVQSLQAARDRLLELMQNAETTEELLLAEQQLTQRETEIEGLQGRLQYLSQSAQLSRIDITLTPYLLSQPPDIGWRPAETTRRAYESLLNSGRDFLDFLIVFVIAVLPWLLAAGLFLTLIYRFIWRPFRARRQ